MSQKNSHPSHPIRNFFYLLWSLLNTLAFVGLFVFLTLPVLPYRPIFLFVTLVVLLLALVFGVIRPALKVKRK